MDKNQGKKCDMEKEECRKLYDMMILSLDGALTAQEEQNLMDEIENHPCCFEQLNIEKAYREFLINKITRKQVSPILVESIKMKVREITL